MESFGDRMNLLTDLREIVLLQHAIKNLDDSMELLQGKIDEHPLSKYNNYTPKSTAEKMAYDAASRDLDQLVKPMHRIMVFKNVMVKRELGLREALRTKHSKSFEFLMDTLTENEKKLVNSPSNEQIGETYTLQSDDTKPEIKGFNLDEYFKEQEQGKMVK